MQQAAQPPDPGAPAAPRPRLAMAPALYPPAPSARRTGAAEVRAHHGEVVQGMFYAPDGTLEHGLVTLPCPLFATRARFRPTPTGPLTVEPGDRLRARTAARMTLDALGRTGWGGSLRLEGSVPLRWGCGSSTTDVLSTISAVADAFGTVLPPEWVSRISVAAESASDSLMHGPERAVLFAQRRGCVLEDLGAPLPGTRVLGFNTENGGVETLTLPPCPYSAWELEAFRAVRGLLRRAVAEQDPALLGRVATASTVLMQRHRPKRAMPELLRLAREARALGVQVAHSGTVAGLLFEPGRQAADRVEQARDGLRRLGIDRSWEFTTDLAPHPEALP
ncbi:MAG TPA: hypothetical protein VF665_12700 [Longimicrobium sp.]|uniref:GHMP family kinase ATP-binding protein n=1 Tax=Longimicrobium sp. TaxID=2029185 RepID=UPI002EDBAC1F